MLDGLKKLEDLLHKLNVAFSTNLLYMEVINMATVGQEIISSALNRTENVGAH